MNVPPRVFRFPGGLILPGHKAESTQIPIQVAPVPPQLVLPLQQHLGAPAKPRVRVGDTVLRGQTVAEADGYVSAALHAPSSGTVTAIGPRPVPHPSGLTAPCIVIDTDGRDREPPMREWEPCGDFTRLETGEIYERVRRAGIVGLGGAAFPSSVKLRPGRPVDTLILNGAECEPYISCDHLLMAERAEEIVAGARVILHALGARQCLFGIEDNKPEAIRALNGAAQVDPRIRIVVVPTRYPQGGEKQLIQALTGLEVPSEGLPLDLGIVCHNPGTARAVWRAIRYAEPLISRVVSVTGGGILQPQNFEVRIGTPVSFLLRQAGGITGEAERPIMGGPMMGFTLPSDEVPVVKATNCILVLPRAEMREPAPAQPCIRCGDCVSVCPAGLLPQQLYWHARAREFEKTRALNLFDCIECGCCAHVCPSRIPLVQYYRHAKTEIWNEEREKQQAEAARERFELRKLRLEREDKAKEEARRRKKEELAARAAAQKAQSMSVPISPDGSGLEP